MQKSSMSSDSIAAGKDAAISTKKLNLLSICVNSLLV